MTSLSGRRGPAAGAIRVALLCAIAAAELMAFQLSLDQGAILDSPRWWARVLWYYPALFNIALLCGASVAVLARAQIARIGRAWALEATALPVAPYLGAHVALIALLYGLSVAGFQRGVAAGAHADLWFLAWLVCGVLAVAAWGCALARPPLWIDFLRNSSRSIFWGVALGCVLWLSAEILSGLFFEFGRLPTLLAVVATLRATGHDVAYTEEPARVVFEGFGIRMSAGCLGYEGIALVIVFCAAYLVASRRELAFPRSFLLVALAALASWGMNVLRVAALVLIGAKRGVYAIEGFHSVAGWLYFAAIAAGVVALSQRRWFAAEGSESFEAGRWRSPAAPYLMPLLVLIATALVSKAFFTGPFDLLYPLRALVVALVLLMHRHHISELGWRGSAWAALPGALIFLGWLALEPAPLESAIPAGLAQLPGWAGVGWLAFRVFGSSLTVPLAEELAFRGYVIRKLTASDFEAVPYGRSSAIALIASSLMFGAMHGRFLAGTLAGVALALTLTRRGRLADAVIAHGTANALIACYVLTTQRWSLWD